MFLLETETIRYVVLLAVVLVSYKTRLRDRKRLVAYSWL